MKKVCITLFAIALIGCSTDEPEKSNENNSIDDDVFTGEELSPEECDEIFEGYTPERIKCFEKVNWLSCFAAFYLDEYGSTAGIEYCVCKEDFKCYDVVYCGQVACSPPNGYPAR